MRRKGIFFAVLILFLILSCGRRRVSEPPILPIGITEVEGQKKLVVKKIETSQAPKLDGELSEKCWQETPEIKFVFLDGVPEPPKEKTIARMVYDNENIYVGVECFESEMEYIFKNVTERDGEVWMDDYIEIFFDPNHDHTSNYQILINAGGVVADLYHADSFSGGDHSWNSDCKVCVVLKEDKWIVEMAVPFKSFGIKRPLKNATWGFNIGRGRQAKLNVGFEDTAFSPTMSTSSHCPDKFADWEGINIP